MLIAHRCLAIAEQRLHSTKVFSVSHSAAPASWLGLGRRLAGDTAGTAALVKLSFSRPSRFSCFCPSSSLPHPTAERKGVSEQLVGVSCWPGSTLQIPTLFNKPSPNGLTPGVNKCCEAVVTASCCARSRQQWEIPRPELES